MTQEEIQTSIQNFYKENNIAPERFTDEMEKHYREGLDYDVRICRPRLEAALKKWLNNFEEQDQFWYLRMFEHFTYLTQRDFEYRVYCLKEYVFHVLSGCSQDKIMIVFSESSKGYKSGSSQMSAAWWKACGGEMSKSQLIEAYSKVTMENLKEMDAIVFADDIVATGFTLSNTIRDFFKRFPIKEFAHTRFFATGVIAAKRGQRTIDNLKKEGWKVQWIYDEEYSKQAFKGEYIFSGGEKRAAEAAVLKYEENVGKDADGKSYVMGYEKSKLLVGFHYEIPNNTLCTFWRYGERHVPLFERSGNQSLSLQEIRARKKKLQNNAYQMKSEEEI